MRETGPAEGLRRSPQAAEGLAQCQGDDAAGPTDDEPDETAHAFPPLNRQPARASPTRTLLVPRHRERRRDGAAAIAGNVGAAQSIRRLHNGNPVEGALTGVHLLPSELDAVL
jgi:hypothetical protein